MQGPAGRKAHSLLTQIGTSSSLHVRETAIASLNVMIKAGSVTMDQLPDRLSLVEHLLTLLSQGSEEVGTDSPLC